MIVDTHCHLDDDCYDEDREELISSLVLNNVESAFVVGTDLASCKEIMGLVDKYDNLYAILGLYPEYANQYNSEMEDFILQNASHPKVVAIGEIGLDYHSQGFDSQKQKEVLLKQLILADKLNLPVCIHVRDAFGDILQLFEENKQYLKNGGVIHCFSGSPEVAKQFALLGFKLGFGGVCTFKNAKKVVDTLKQIDAKDILLETDAPYLCPEPFRGNRNEPKQTNLVLNKIAEIRGEDKKQLEKQIYLNTLEVFKKYKK
ncbi:MAG: TatD family hydrolase [Christensenellales bacterium]